jgi:hypothetical protein
MARLPAQCTQKVLRGHSAAAGWESHPQQKVRGIDDRRELNSSGQYRHRYRAGTWTGGQGSRNKRTDKLFTARSGRSCHGGDNRATMSRASSFPTAGSRWWPMAGIAPRGTSQPDDRAPSAGQLVRGAGLRVEVLAQDLGRDLHQVVGAGAAGEVLHGGEDRVGDVVADLGRVLGQAAARRATAGRTCRWLTGSLGGTGRQGLPFLSRCTGCCGRTRRARWRAADGLVLADQGGEQVVDR